MRWRFLVSPAADGAANMALDEALMRRATRAGEGVFRVYTWSGPTLSLGRNQRARDAYDLDRARSLGVQFVRRPTGGRALLHDHEITYSATLPTATPEAAADAYTFINTVLLEAIGRLGVPAKRATDTESIPPGLRPCFDAPSAGEIVVGARKLVGSSQWRRAEALLQHGSILVRDDQGIVAQVMKVPIVPPAAATLADALGREPDPAEFADLARTALADATGTSVTALDDDPELRAEAEALRATYLDDAWTWRR